MQLNHAINRQWLERQAKGKSKVRPMGTNERLEAGQDIYIKTLEALIRDSQTLLAHWRDENMPSPPQDRVDAIMDVLDREVLWPELSVK
jgi:hypothetical protein